MTPDTMARVARFWNDSAWKFDSIYTGKEKGALGRAMDRFFRKDMFQRLEWVMRKCGDVSGKSICDIGCGSGRFVTAFAKQGAEQVIGVDVAPTMLQLARNLAEQDGVSDRCDFVLGDVLNWKTPRRFDITIAIGLWDYIANPIERLKVIRGVTQGTFLSAWPRVWTWRMPIRKVRLQYIQGCPVYFFRKRAVYQMLDSAGFEVVTCDAVGKLFCVEARPKA